MDTACSPVDDTSGCIDCGIVTTEPDHSRFHPDTCPQGLEGTTTGIIRPRGIPEKAQVSSVRTRTDTGTDGVHDTADPFTCNLVKDGGAGSLERGKAPEFFAGTIRDAIEYKEQDLSCRHQEKIRVKG
jgi:hypothetical protein